MIHLLAFKRGVDTKLGDRYMVILVYQTLICKWYLTRLVVKKMNTNKTCVMIRIDHYGDHFVLAFGSLAQHGFFNLLL